MVIPQRKPSRNHRPHDATAVEQRHYSNGGCHFCYVMFMVIAIFKPLFVCHCSDDPASSLVSYHRVVPTFALSSGLRMWIKLIMSEANLMDNTNRTEFRVEVGRDMYTSCTMFFPCMCHHTPLIWLRHCSRAMIVSFRTNQLGHLFLQAGGRWDSVHW